MAIELAMIFLIAGSKVEWEKRAMVWYVCLCRGINVDMPKTHQLTMWARQLPMYYAYFFLFLHAFTVYLTLDPKLEKGDLTDILQACLSILDVLFVLLMTKDSVVIEGVNSLLTLNMFAFFFEDKKILEHRGFRVVSLSRL